MYPTAVGNHLVLKRKGYRCELRAVVSGFQLSELETIVVPTAAMTLDASGFALMFASEYLSACLFAFGCGFGSHSGSFQRLVGHSPPYGRRLSGENPVCPRMARPSFRILHSTPSISDIASSLVCSRRI